MISFLGCKNTESDKNAETDKQDFHKEYANLIVSEQQDSLIMVSTWELLKFGAPCAFVNSKRDTIIPFGKYHA